MRQSQATAETDTRKRHSKVALNCHKTQHLNKSRAEDPLSISNGATWKKLDINIIEYQGYRGI